MINTDELLTRKELGVILKISESAIVRLEKKGMPVIVIGPRSRRYRYTEILNWFHKKYEGVRKVLQQL